MWKHRILAPESWGAYQRNDFSEPSLLHPPIHRKALNSLTWDIWFSLINNNLFDVQTTCPLLQNFYITWLLPSPLWSSLSELSEMLSPGLQSTFLPQIKLNLQLSCCAFFLSHQFYHGLCSTGFNSEDCFFSYLLIGNGNKRKKSRLATFSMLAVEYLPQISNNRIKLRKKHLASKCV